MNGTVAYLYCVVRAAERPRLGRVPTGLPGAARPSIGDVGSALWLVLADVPLDRYGPGRIEASLGDMQWVGDVALAHEGVVEHFARRHAGAVIPMKLFTMFSNTEKAVAEIRARRPEIEAVARRIAGCEEWGVRITRSAAVAERRARGRATATSGAAFLAAKKQARDEIRAVRTRAIESAECAFDTFARLAREVRRRTDAPESAVSPPLVDAAYLVPLTKRARFRTAARALGTACRSDGADLTLTGPWPAYNFVHLTEPLK